MGTRGPAPKRSDQRLRRNTNYKPRSGVAGEGSQPPFEGDEKWHPVAKEMWASLPESGQSKWYEPSDWVSAYILCETISRELEPQFVGFAEGYDEDGRAVKMPVSTKIPIKGASMSAMRAWMASLLITEADRKRAEIELHAGTPTPEGGTADARLLDFMAAARGKAEKQG